MPTFGKRIDGPGGRRNRARERVALTASARMTGQAKYVLVDDLCSTGAKLRGANLPDSGARMLLRFGALDVPVSVAWRREEHCGVSFEPPLDQSKVRRLKLEGRSGQVMAIV